MALRKISNALGSIICGLLRVYQSVISPLLPPACRFEPSCSQYMIDAVRKKGPLLGVLMGLWRILRCNPFVRGGYDPVD